MEEKKENKTLFVIGGVLLIILILGASFAYFQIVANNNATNTTISGAGELVGQATLSTNIAEIKLKITAEMMHKDNVGKKYYATESGEAVEIPTLGNGRYTLATANLTESDVALDCTYSYDISASVSNEITDNSANDINIIIYNARGEVKKYNLNELLSGVTYEDTFKNLLYQEDQNIIIEAYIENTSDTQNNLSGNEFIITFTPKNENEGLSCHLQKNIGKMAKEVDFASYLISNKEEIDGLWSSGLEGDGLRYVGTGSNICVYDEGKYSIAPNNDLTCPKRYHYLEKTSFNTTKYEFKTSCPSDSSYATHECTELIGILRLGNISNNFVCFGTNNKEECLSEEVDTNGLSGIDKYMYRIIGVFPDEEGNQHLKLIKNTKTNMTNYYSDYDRWHGDKTVDTNWEDSDLFKGLNGSYFLTNSSYNYLQETTWSDKIVEWKWTAVNTKTRDGSGGPNYSMINSDGLTPTQIYLHEMNRSSKTSTIGEWTYPKAKIGLMYVSDFALSLGDIAKSIIKHNIDNQYILKKGWISDRSEWTISRRGFNNSFTEAYVWSIYTGSFINDATSNVISNYVRPVFYLTSDVVVNNGAGTLENPYIIKQ